MTPWWRWIKLRTEMNQASYIYRCTLHRVIDGDTIEVMVDLGFKRYSREKVRIAGIDAPERNTQWGPAATDFTKHWCEDAELLLESHKSDSFGRWLGAIYKTNAFGGEIRSLAADLLDSGNAIPYRA